MAVFKFMRYGAFSDDAITNEDLAAWSEESGFALPPRYVAFMARFNGGSIYPSVFEHQHPQLDRIAALAEFFDWKEVLTLSDLDLPPEKREIAPDHLVIGRTTLNDEVVLRLGASGPGPVLLVGHNTRPTWIEDGETEFGFIAPDFNAFIDGLRESKPDETVYLGVWDSKSVASSEAAILDVEI